MFESLDSMVKKHKERLAAEAMKKKLKIAKSRAQGEASLILHDESCKDFLPVLARFNEQNGEAKIHAEPLTAWPLVLGEFENEPGVLELPQYGNAWEARDPTRTPLVDETAEYLSSDGFKDWKKKSFERFMKRQEARRTWLENQIADGRKIARDIEEKRKERGKKTKPWWKIW